MTAPTEPHLLPEAEIAIPAPSDNLHLRHERCHSDRLPMVSTYPTNPVPHEKRLNLLLTYGGWRESATAKQLPTLLAPLGIQSIHAETGEDAVEVIRAQPVHIAVVDLEIPFKKNGGPTQAAGNRVLQLLRRLDPVPPTIVVRAPQPSQRDSIRGLSASLREGAFAVVDRPFPLEMMLEILRRVLRRHYAGLWPT